MFKTRINASNSVEDLKNELEVVERIAVSNIKDILALERIIIIRNRINLILKNKEHGNTQGDDK